MDGNRQEVLDKRVRGIVANVTSSACYWHLPQADCLDVAPTWDELRDSLLRAIFEADREQFQQELHAQFVVENCL